MFLTKNRLKKIKKVEDDDMLNYLEVFTFRTQ